MKTDPFGVVHYTSDELFDLLYQSPTISLNHMSVSDPDKFNKSIQLLHVKYAPLTKYTKHELTVAEFDKRMQSDWFMPQEYKELDIAKFVLDLCKTDAELQRVGQELMLFQDRDMFNLLRFMKYFVDNLRKNKIIWGVGRGSSVASYVLYLLGVHKVNSLYYQLDITEFLK